MYFCVYISIRTGGGPCLPSRMAHMCGHMRHHLPASSALSLHHQHMWGKTLGFLPVFSYRSTVMVSVAIIQPAIRAVMHKIWAMLGWRCTKYPTPIGGSGGADGGPSSQPREFHARTSVALATCSSAGNGRRRGSHVRPNPKLYLSSYGFKGYSPLNVSERGISL